MALMALRARGMNWAVPCGRYLQASPVCPWPSLSKQATMPVSLHARCTCGQKSAGTGCGEAAALELSSRTNLTAWRSPGWSHSTGVVDTECSPRSINSASCCLRRRVRLWFDRSQSRWRWVGCGHALRCDSCRQAVPSSNPYREQPAG